MKRLLLVTLVVSALGLASCGGNEPASKDDAASAAPGSGKAASSELLALLPSAGEVPGWSISRGPRAFDADSLWELINGAADGFVAYGVQEVVTADYKHAGAGHEAVIEIYRMKDPLHAFGKYSEERYPDYRFLDVGNEGYSGGTSVNFWTGPYYVKVTTFKEDEVLNEELVKLARSVAGKVTDPGAEPAELSCLPKENQVTHTTKYLAKDVLAQSYFTGGFEAQYKAGGKESKVVLIPMAGPAEAGEALGRYREAVGGAKGARALRGVGEEGFAAADSFYGTIVAARQGRHVAVALGAATEDAGRKQVADVLRCAQ